MSSKHKIISKSFPEPLYIYLEDIILFFKRTGNNLISFRNEPIFDLH